MVENMPETFSLDDLIDRVLLIQKVEKALVESENEEGMDWEDVKKEMDKWLE